MTELRLHDTMAREKRVFTPADPERVTMYVCGPTVYNRAHIGNARPYVVFDVLGRLVRHIYGADSLVYARNFTDVDDKIIDAARAEGVDPAVVTARYEQLFLDDMSALGVLPTSMMPRATEHIAEMVAMIARLIETGHAYEADGHILFHVPSDPDYGALGRRDREAMIAGARVEVASYKKDPSDFVLWKPSAPEVIGWDSPWGRGRPGWHIECSAMIERHLGETIDIHAGGIDLIFPHHENEIAQSRCAHGGAPLARYWLHNGFLSMAGSEKMSKSLGNVVTVADLLAQGHDGEVLRLALLSAHYRQPLEWSVHLVEQKTAELDGLHWAAGYTSLDDTPLSHEDVDGGLVEVLCEDLNTPLAISWLHEMANTCEVIAKRVLKDHGNDPSAVLPATWAKELYPYQRRLRATARLLGLSLDRSKSDFGKKLIEVQNMLQSDKDLIEERILARTEAKKNRDFAEADRIRAELAGEGIILEDGSQGTSWRRA